MSISKAEEGRHTHSGSFGGPSARKDVIDCFHLLVLIVTSRKTTSSHIPAHHRASHVTALLRANSFVEFLS